MTMLLAIPFVIGLFAFAFGKNAAVAVARTIIISFGIFALLVIRAIIIG